MVSAWLLSLASYSNAQTTGNVINNTQQGWTGCSTPQSSGFWGGTSGGPCPGIYDNGGYGGQIVFSYGEYTLSQTADLATILPNSGNGLIVNGYTYHWHVKNSNINGQQPGQYDSTASVNVSLMNGKNVIESDTYDYGYHIPNWTTFNGTRTYTNPYSLAQADSITLSVTGKDNGFWAGYYGPEFQHFDLRVNYSVDPCYDNPLYSTSCAGFADALAALTPDTSEMEDTTGVPEIIQPDNSGTSTAPVEEITIATVPTVDAGGIEVSTTGELVIPGDVKKEEPPAQLEKVEETQQEKREKPQVDYSLISSIVKRETDLTNTLNIVNQSISQSTESQHILQQSLTDSEVSAIGESDSFSNSSSSETTQDTQVNNIVQSSSGSNGGGNNSTNDQQENNTASLDDKTNTNKRQASNQQSKAQPNEAAAGGVSMNDFTKAPIGFNSYQIQMADAQFYAPKEIYKNQQNVDNVRLMRGLGSDRVHQQMVQQQYGR